MSAIIGDLEFVTEDGTVLKAPNDLRLAWLWAEHENGAAWATMTYGNKCADAGAALTELRRAAEQRPRPDLPTIERA